MPVPRGSRFAGLPVYQVVGPDGRPRQVFGLRLTSDTRPGTRLHRVTHGEGVDLVARRALGDEGLWWRVLDVNPVRYPLDLDAGDTLLLPEPGPATRADRARTF